MKKLVTFFLLFSSELSSTKKSKRACERNGKSTKKKNRVPEFFRPSIRKPSHFETSPFTPFSLFDHGSFSLNSSCGSSELA